MKTAYCFPFALLFLLLLSCNNAGNGAGDYEDNGDSIAGGAAIEEPKLVKTGSLHFKVADVTQSTKALSGLAQQVGGTVIHQNLEYVETGRNELRTGEDSLLVVSVFMPQADITVRLPSQHLESFMFAVADLGYFTSSSQLDIDDKSLQYLQHLMKQKAREATLESPVATKDQSFTNAQAIAIKDEAIDRAIANKAIDADVKFSTVTLNLTQNPLVRKETIANDVIADYKLPFYQRLGYSISNGWQYFLNLIVVLANLWIFLLLGLAGLLCYRYWKRGRLAPYIAKLK